MTRCLPLIICLGYFFLLQATARRGQLTGLSVTRRARGLLQDCDIAGYQFWPQQDSLENITLSCTTYNSSASNADVLSVTAGRCSDNDQCQAFTKSQDPQASLIKICLLKGVVRPLIDSNDMNDVDGINCYGLYEKACPEPPGWKLSVGKDLLSAPISNQSYNEKPLPLNMSTSNPFSACAGTVQGCKGFVLLTSTNLDQQSPYTAFFKSDVITGLFDAESGTSRSNCDGLWVPVLIPPPIPPSPPRPPTSPPSPKDPDFTTPGSIPSPRPPSPIKSPPPPLLPSPPPIAPPPPPTIIVVPADNKDKSNVAAIAGGVAGGVSGLLLIGLLGLWLYRRNKGHIGLFGGGGKDRFQSQGSTDPIIGIKPPTGSDEEAYGVGRQKPLAGDALAVVVPHMSRGGANVSWEKPGSTGTFRAARADGSSTGEQHTSSDGVSSSGQATGTSTAVVPVLLASAGSNIANQGSMEPSTASDNLEQQPGNTSEQNRPRARPGINTMKIKWEELQVAEDQLLGKGGFGYVYKGLWKGVIPVAVKTLNVEKMKSGALDELRREARAMSERKHPCIATVYGVVNDGVHHALVMRYYKRDTLARVIGNGKLEEFNFITRLNMAIMVASGLECLHEGKPNCIIHGDLKSSNILIEDNGFQVVIADFGLSCFLQKGQTGQRISSGAMTVTISPPEVLNNPHAPRTAAGDVYAFGVLLYELMTAKPAYMGMRPGQIVTAVVGGDRLTVPGYVPTEMAEIIKVCWSQRAEDRPVITDVLHRLCQYKTQVLNTEGGGVDYLQGGHAVSLRTTMPFDTSTMYPDTFR